MDETIAQQALDSAKSAHHRIDKLEEDVKDVHTLAEAMAGMQKEMSNVKDDVTEIKDAVSTLKDKPTQLWNTIVIAVITALASGVVGFLLAHIH
jgi:ubiquinone biosynthesis protein UbiJ